MKNILLIGCGHMGGALLESWVKSNQYSLTVIDPIKYTSLNKKYKKSKIKIENSILDLKNLTQFSFIVFATKPIDIYEPLNKLSKNKLNNKTVIISVAAGIKINKFEKKLKDLNNFFRVMPNMPASIGESMNCIVASNLSKKSKINEVIKLFSYSGKTILLNNENQIDKITAISGSGPGFVFNIVDAMEQAAIKLGFTEKVSRKLILQTFRGSIKMLSKSKLNAKQLVNIVATKGGTTEAGLNIMKKNKFHKTFVDLTKASYKKAKEQGKINAKK